MSSKPRDCLINVDRVPCIQVCRVGGQPRKKAENTTTIVFMHVPKAGGTTLHAVLKDFATNVQHACISEHTNKFLALSGCEQQHYGVVSGHIGHGMWDQPGWKISRQVCETNNNFLRLDKHSVI